MSTTTAVYALTKPTNLGDSGVWGTPVDTNFDVIDDVLARPKIVQNAPTYNVAGTTTLDLSLARVFVFTVSGASTLAFSNVPSATFDVRVALVISNGGAFVLTFPASVTWLSGSAPPLKVSGVDIIDLETKDGGTTWFGSIRAASTLAVSGAAAQGIASINNTNMTTALAINVALITTFNSAGNDLTAVRVLVTDTASAAGAKALSIAVGGTTIFRVPKEGGVILQGAALATSATRGFAYMPTCAGAPSGVPTAETGCAPMVYDTTNNKIWFYNGSWRGVVVT